MMTSLPPTSNKDADSLLLHTRANASAATSPTKLATHMTTTTLKVGGMTCGSCTSAVESGFKDVPGVGSISVSLVMERAVIVHDAEKVTAEQCQEIVEDRGFDADILSSDAPQQATEDEDEGDVTSTADEVEVTKGNTEGMLQTIVTVGGMTCGACTSAVEGAFKDMAGIKSFSISLLSERAVLEHDPSLISAEKIVETIEDVGFDASLIESNPVAKAVSQPRRRKQNSAKSASTTTTVAIEGMTCGACTSAVEGGFKDLPGLVRFNISLLAERAIITHDPTRLSAAQVAEIIEDRGFDATILSSVEEAAEATSAINTVQLKIYGLPDAEESQALASTLLEREGITRATVSYSTSRASITYQSSHIGLRAIVRAIENAGYNALVAENDDNNAQLESLAKTKEIQEWSRSFRISLCFAIPVFLTSMVFPMLIPFLDFGSLQILPGLWLGDIVCLLLTIPVQFGIGRRFYVSAFKSLRHGSPTMDVLVVLGTSAAFFFSCAAMLVSLFSPQHSKPATTFDTSTMLITFILLGRFLENRAKGQTSKALSRLMSLAPSSAIIYADPIAAAKAAEAWDEKTSGGEKASAEKESGGQSAIEEQNVPTELLEVGDVVILRPGDKIPADGIVTRGESYVDESMVTGEAMPILKTRGVALMAGTVNGAGRVDFKVTRAGRDTQLSQIVRLVQDAQTSRAPIQRVADTVAGYFVPIIITLGLATFFSWMVLSHVLPKPPKIFTDDSSGGAFMVCVKLCIAVIVFACPCALGLATPTAVMVGTGVGAEQGILIKGGAALETATKITHVVMDKTGTLTVGKMSVSKANITSIWTSETSRTRLWWSLIGLAESSSEHPIARAIFNAAKTNLRLGIDGFIDGTVGEFESVVGKGITATVEATISPERKQYEVSIGNASYLRSRGVSIPPSPEEQYDAYTTDVLGEASSSKASNAGTTTIHTAISGEYTGTLHLSDTLKPTAAAAVSALRRMGIPTSIVTGDQATTAHHVAKLLSIPAANVHASVLPSGKRAIIEDLQAHGEIVAMVGDGINDSPALATANVGISLSSGTDVAMEAADVVLMKPDNLLDVPASLQLSRSIFNRIRLNLLWACVYNAIGLPIAMGFLLPWGITLPPLAAGAAMACSSVTVVMSSLLLKWWKRPKWMETVAELDSVRDASSGRSRGVLSKIIASMTGRQGETERGAYMPLRDLETV